MALLLGILLLGGVTAGLQLASVVSERPDARPVVWRNLLVHVRAADGSPVPGAAITLHREKPGLTPRFFASAGAGPADAEGDAFYRLHAGMYRLTVRAEGHLVKRHEVDLREGDAETVVRLGYSAEMAGRVSGPEGIGVPEATVRVRGREGSRETRTGEDGVFVLSRLPWASGLRWVVDVEAPHHLFRPPAEVKLVSASERGRIRVPPIRLVARATVSARLSGRRAEDAELFLTDRYTRDPLVDLPGEAWFRSARPIGDGAVEARAVPPVTLDAVLRLDGVSHHVSTIHPEPGEILDLGDIRVPSAPDGVVAGRVVFQPGEPPIGGARLLHDRDFHQAAEDGTFRLEGLTGEKVTLLAGVKYRDRWLMLREEVEVGREDLILHPTPARRLRITFETADGDEPIEGVPLALAVGDPPGAGSDFTLFRGVLWTLPLEPGTHPVTIRVNGYETLRLTDVRIHPDRETRLNVRLIPYP
jgi:hypothetical protein